MLGIQVHHCVDMRMPFLTMWRYSQGIYTNGTPGVWWLECAHYRYNPVLVIMASELACRARSHEVFNLGIRKTMAWKVLLES